MKRKFISYPLAFANAAMLFLMIIYSNWGYGQAAASPRQYNYCIRSVVSPQEGTSLPYWQNNNSSTCCGPSVCQQNVIFPTIMVQASTLICGYLQIEVFDVNNMAIPIITRYNLQVCNNTQTAPNFPLFDYCATNNWGQNFYYFTNGITLPSVGTYVIRYLLTDIPITGTILQNSTPGNENLDCPYTYNIGIPDLSNLTFTATVEKGCNGAGIVTFTSNFQNFHPTKVLLDYGQGSPLLTDITNTYPLPTNQYVNGTYTATMYLTFPCSTTPIPVSVQFNVSPFSVTVTNPNPNGCGTSSILTATANDASTYKWAKGGSVITGATASTYTATTAGTYSVTATSTANGCTAIASTIVNVNPQPTASITASTSTICSGQPVTLTASGGGTYQWSTGATSNVISVSPTVNTTYTVTVMGSGNCSATASKSINVNQTPSPNISSSASGICSGQSVTLTASGGGTYQWKLNNVAITGATNSSYTTSTSGTYTVVVISTSGCSVTSSPKIISSGSLPSVSIEAPNPRGGTPQNPVLCLGANKLNAVPSSTSYAYNWSTNTTGGNGSSTILILTNYNPVIVSVTVTDIASGCTATAQKQLQPDGVCCGDFGSGQNAVKIGSQAGFVNISDLNPFTDGLGGWYLDVLGTDRPAAAIDPNGDLRVLLSTVFNINQNTTLEDLYIRAQLNTKIVVRSGKTLTLKNSKIDACNYMWDGIVVEPGATLIIDNCQIEEAKAAVSIQGNANFSVTNTALNDNFVGINISGFNSITMQKNINNCSFSSGVNGVTLKMPYDSRTVGYKGIEILNSMGNSSANPALILSINNCSFNKLDFGVFATNTQINVQSSTFTNINRNTNNDIYSGNAIHIADNETTKPYTRQLLVNNCTFSHGYQAILFDDMNANITNNNLDDMVVGIRGVRGLNLQSGRGVPNQFVVNNNNITLNSINNVSNAVINSSLSTNTAQNPTSTVWGRTQVCFFKYGILIQGSPVASVNIESNIIRLPTFSNQSIRFCNNNGPAEGIRVEHILTNNSGNTIVQNNSIRDGYVGTRLVNQSPRSGNPINIYNNNQVYDINGTSAFTGTGFVLDNCQNTSLFCNEVLGSNLYVNQSNYRRLAFQFNMSRNGLTLSNFMTTARTGFQFNGNCSSPNRYAANSFNNLLVGMEFRNGAQIGAQTSSYGVFAMSNRFNTVGTAFNIISGNLTYSDRLTNFTNVTQMTNNTLSLIFANSPFPNLIVNNCVQNATVFRIANPDPAVEQAEEVYQQINEGVQGTFAVPAEYMLKRDLYATLDKHPPLIVNDEDLAAFYETAQEENIGKLTDMQKKLDYVVGQFADIKEQYANDEQLKEQAMQAEYQAKMAEINAIIPDNQIEQNEIVVSKIYLNTIAKGIYSFTEDELMALYAVADQCPFAGGEPVYKARTMIGVTGDQVIYDDQNNCALGFYKTSPEEENLPSANNPISLQILNVYPNPANDIVRVEYYMPEQKTVSIELTDMLGRKVSTQPVSYTANDAIVPVGDIATGMYQLVIKVEGVKVACEKITVHH